MDFNGDRCQVLLVAAVLGKQPKRWTYEEYARLHDDQRYEIIDGNLLTATATDTWHQSWIGELFVILKSHTEHQKLGKVLLSPVDVVLDSENTVQPDLVFIAGSNLTVIQRTGIFGVPDRLVEFIPLPACGATATTKRTSTPVSA